MNAFETMRAIRDLHGVSGAHKAILYAMVLRTDNDTGECWPSYPTLAADAGVSLDAIGEVRSGLIWKKHLVVDVDLKSFFDGAIPITYAAGLTRNQASQMIDDEYKSYLAALARRHIKLTWLLSPGPDMRVLGFMIDRLSAASRLLWVVRDREENAALVAELAKELRQVHLESIIFEMERSGVFDALDENPELTFGELRRSAVPDEDAKLLANAGIAEPEAEILLLIQYARRQFHDRSSSDSQLLPSERAHQAQPELQRAIDRLEKLAEASSQSVAPPKKRRKLFNGIGKLLGGTITAAGNLLLVGGSVIAPNPATAFGAIGSCAVAIASIGQGIGDLRGE